MELDQGAYALALTAARREQGLPALNLALFNEELHPRNHGKFARKLESLPSGQSLNLLDGTSIHKGDQLPSGGHLYSIHPADIKTHGRSTETNAHSAATRALSVASPQFAKEQRSTLSSLTSKSGVRWYHPSDKTLTEKGFITPRVGVTRNALKTHRDVLAQHMESGHLDAVHHQIGTGLDQIETHISPAPGGKWRVHGTQMGATKHEHVADSAAAALDHAHAFSEINKTQPGALRHGIYKPDAHGHAQKAKDDAAHEEKMAGYRQKLHMPPKGGGYGVKKGDIVETKNADGSTETGTVHHVASDNVKVRSHVDHEIYNYDHHEVTKVPPTPERMTPGNFNHLGTEKGGIGVVKTSPAEDARKTYEHHLSWVKNLKDGHQYHGSIGGPDHSVVRQGDSYHLVKTTGLAKAIHKDGLSVGDAIKKAEITSGSAEHVTHVMAEREHKKK